MSYKILLTVLVLGLSGWIMTNQNYNFWVVQSGSMEPSLMIGDLIVTQKQTGYQTGEVITFKNKDGKIVTHRINKISNNIFFTKGDANRIEDSATTNNGEVLGKVVQVIPKLGVLVNLMQTKNNMIALFWIPTGITIISQLKATLG